MNWKEFWDTENTIYVSQRHIDENYAAITGGVLPYLSQTSKLLDFGCGYALSTPAFIAHGQTVFLYDPVPKMQDFVRAKFGSETHVHIVNKVEDIPDSSLGTVVVHSVLQYVPKSELPALVTLFARKLSLGGNLILSDLVPPHVNPIHDVLVLLRVAFTHGYFFATCVSLVRTFFSNYRSIRAKEGFSTFTEDEVVALLEKSGFTAKRIPNIGLLPQRMAILGCKK